MYMILSYHCESSWMHLVLQLEQFWNNSMGIFGTLLITSQRGSMILSLGTVQLNVKYWIAFWSTLLVDLSTNAI